MKTSGATLLEKTIMLDKFQIIKYQLQHYCFMKNITLNPTDLNCLAFLGELGRIRLTDFSEKAASRKILGSASAVSNCVGRLANRNFIVKDGVGKKMIQLNPKHEILSEGNIVIKLNLFKLESDKASKDLRKNSEKVELA